MRKRICEITSYKHKSYREKDFEIRDLKTGGLRFWAYINVGRGKKELLLLLSVFSLFQVLLLLPL